MPYRLGSRVDVTVIGQLLKSISELKVHPFIQVEQEKVDLPQMMAATRFTIASRKRIFGKYSGDQEPLLRWEDLNKEELVPALFRWRAQLPGKGIRDDGLILAALALSF